MAIFGWMLHGAERHFLLQTFAPTWPDVIADHITLRAAKSTDSELPGATTAEIVGIINDGEGVEALIVAVEGTIFRPDGKIFHITWSIDSAHGRKPVESNTVIDRLGFQRLETAVPIRIVPARLDIP